MPLSEKKTSRSTPKTPTRNPGPFLRCPKRKRFECRHGGKCASRDRLPLARSFFLFALILQRKGPPGDDYRGVRTSSCIKEKDKGDKENKKDSLKGGDDGKCGTGIIFSVLRRDCRGVLTNGGGLVQPVVYYHLTKKRREGFPQASKNADPREMSGCPQELGR